MKKIIFITGASGVGKTTILKKLKEKNLNANWLFLHFDLAGVPSTENMIKEFGSPEKWQKAMTFKWIDDLVNNHQDKEIVILEGQVNFDFIKDGFFKHEFKNYKIVHIDCSKDVMMERLKNERNQPELATEDMKNWLKFLKKQAEEAEVDIIDTSSISAEKSVEKFERILLEF